MHIFEYGKVINSSSGEPITIIKYLASGGQDDVYIVEYGEKQKALKWYNPQVLREPDAFYENLRRNADKGSPDKTFLWPDAVTERIEGSFGYIMDLRPEGYYELSKILASEKYSFTSFKAATEACIRIVSAFRILHNNGYCYQNLNDGNFFIEPKTGDVIICNTEDITPQGINAGILGKPRYMSPEMIVGKGNVYPSAQSGRYTLSIILFLILFLNHPLEGERWLVPCMTDSIAEKLYGSDAVFIFDRDDDTNRPVKNVHVNVINRWRFMPAYLKDAFCEAFSQQALKEPNLRPRERTWLDILVRFKSDIAKCSCGNEVFIQNAVTTKCDICGKPVVVNNTIKLPAYSIIATKGSRVYRCQLGTCNADDALNPVALVVAKPDGTLGVKNMTQNILNALTPSEKSKQIQPQEVIPFKPGIKIKAFDKTIELC